MGWCMLWTLAVLGCVEPPEEATESTEASVLEAADERRRAREGCVTTFTLSSTDSVHTTTYDSDGYVEVSEIDEEDDGTIDVTDAHTWQLDDRLRPIRQDWDSTDDSFGYVDYDHQGHWVTEHLSTSFFSITWSSRNTYDAAGRIQTSEVSYADPSGVDVLAYTVTYNACGDVETFSSSIDGVPETVAHIEAHYRRDCVLEASLTYDDAGELLQTQRYDLEGRVVELFVEEQQELYTWTWDCP